jgi:hypothetical protein
MIQMDQGEAMNNTNDYPTPIELPTLYEEVYTITMGSILSQVGL